MENARCCQRLHGGLQQRPMHLTPLDVLRNQRGFLVNCLAEGNAKSNQGLSNPLHYFGALAQK
eukprot:6040390-Lingulodinium_polyedra.AAC.1